MRWLQQAAAGVLAAIVLAPAVAAAEDMVVVNARGIGLRVGEKIDLTKPLVLAEGQHVTLIALNGVTIKLDGPYDQPPTAASSGGTLTAALGAFVTQSGPRTGEAGVTRAGTTVANLPDPWVLDVSRSGTVCLITGHQAVFWRPAAPKTGVLSIMPADRSWKAEATWPAGSDRLTVSHDIAIHPDLVFFVSFDGGDENALTVSFVPADLNNDPMRVAWLADQGCEAQAEALQRTVK